MRTLKNTLFSVTGIYFRVQECIMCKECSQNDVKLFVYMHTYVALWRSVWSGPAFVDMVYTFNLFIFLIIYLFVCVINLIPGICYFL